MSCITLYKSQAIRLVFPVVEPNEDDPDTYDIVDISTASSKLVSLLRPDETQITKASSFLTDGVDGKHYADIANGELDQVGTWYIQSLVVIGGKYYPGKRVEAEILETNWSISGTALP